MSSQVGPVIAGAGVPLHRQLFLVLRDEIARGAIESGAPLPTEQTLCEQFGVSRITVRRALADLAAEGYIETRQGVGSFARPQATAPPPPTGSYLDGLRQTQFETEVGVLDYGVRPAPPAVAAVVPFDADALHITRVRRERRTGEPLMVTEAWLPAGLADTITEDRLAHTALYDLLADAGVRIERMYHEVTAETAGPRYAQLLDSVIGSALVRVNRVAFVGGAPHHFVSIVLSPTRSRIVLNQSAAQLEAGEGLAIAHDMRRG